MVGILDGVRAAQENRIEAALVTQLADDLQLNNLVSILGDRTGLKTERSLALHAPNGEVYPDTAEGDSAFWREGLFVVSPHHAQIQAIQKALHLRHT